MTGSLYYLSDIWRFTLLWTLILYAIFHLSAAGVALAIQLLFSGRPAYWRYLWTIPVSYAVVAGVQALVAGSGVALMYVGLNLSIAIHARACVPLLALLALLTKERRHSIGAAYISGPFWMSTWIPFIWGWTCVVVVLISSFSIQGGL